MNLFVSFSFRPRRTAIVVFVCRSWVEGRKNFYQTRFTGRAVNFRRRRSRGSSRRPRVITRDTPPSPVSSLPISAAFFFLLIELYSDHSNFPPKFARTHIDTCEKYTRARAHAPFAPESRRNNRVRVWPRSIDYYWRLPKTATARYDDGGGGRRTCASYGYR